MDAMSENMRVKTNGDNPKLLEFDDWLQRLGDGKLPCHQGTDYVTLRSDICTEIDHEKNSEFQERAIDFVYGDLGTKSTMTNWKDFASKRVILAPTNDIVSQINDTCMEKLPGDMFVFADISRCINPDDATNYTSDLIDTFEAPGVPPALLKLKKGAVVILLRNL